MPSFFGVLFLIKREVYCYFTLRQCRYKGNNDPPNDQVQAPPHHAPTHARPSLPVNPDPNLAPAKEATSGLHDTAAITYCPERPQSFEEFSLFFF